MSFHEKSRWIALVANLIVWGWYFVMVARLVAAGGVPDLPFMLAMTVPMIIALTVIHIAAHVAIAIWRPSEANAPLDERDRAIGNKATAIAYNVLAFGLVTGVGATMFHWTAFFAVNAILFAFILAETVRYAVEIILYRRQAA